jgi:putative aldouronate transport system substrate-binding protein
MLKRNTRIMAVLLMASLAGAMAGCAKKTETSSGTINQGSNNAVPVAVTYPVKTDKTLKYWMQLNSNLASVKKNFGETPLAAELTKKTGIKVEYIHPAQGQEKEQFNLLLASGDMPDIIEYNWYGFPGSPEKALGDGYIVKLNDLVNKYAPDLKKYLEVNQDVNKQIKTDVGSYYVFPFIRGDEKLLTSAGPIIRKDWLDQAGLPVPTTIDEWTVALRAFKEKNGATAPLTMRYANLNWGAWVGAYGVNKGVYLENNKVVFGQIQPGYKQFMTQFRDWYKEGLLDKNFINIDSKTLDSQMTDNKSGAATAFAGSGLNKWQVAMVGKNPNVKFVGAPYPSLKKGELSAFGHKDHKYNDSWSAAITATSKNQDLAAMFLNYGYSDEGRLLYNFGIEGTSYKLENGYPKYTDLLMKNPDKLPVVTAMQLYIRGNYGGPIVQDVRYIEQYMETQEQKDAVNNWVKTDVAKHLMPRITMTPEESSEAAKIINEVNTYCDEMFAKVVMGLEPIENFDKYVEQVKKLGIDKYLNLQQAAVDRYNNRK